MALTAVPLLFALCRASVAPRIDQPLTNDIRPAATIATGMVMSTTPVAAAALAAAVTASLRLATLSMIPLMLIIQSSNNEGSFFSMAEEKSDGEIPRSDPGKNASLDTTPVADVTQDRIEDEAPIPQAPNFPLLVLSWGAFTIGLYFLYAAGMGYYEDNVTEAKLAITILLGILTYPVGMFLRKAAHHGFRDAFAYMMEGMSRSVG